MPKSTIKSIALSWRLVSGEVWRKALEIFIFDENKVLGGWLLFPLSEACSYHVGAGLPTTREPRYLRSWLMSQQIHQNLLVNST